ncbi:MAG: ATP-binding cassette domain-containing protein, partial [Microbacteriaceae bacterium]
MLEVSDVVVRYGAATALDGVSLTVERGEMVALVGPNGAGKSTLVNAICGLLPVARGSITVDGTVAQVPEGRQLFADMTVDENLRLGAWKA